MRALVIAAGLALAACGQSTTPAVEEPAAPLGLMEQIQAAAPDMRPVLAYQQLVAYLGAHPELNATCTGPRGAESRGIVPADVDPASAYGPHAGSLVLSVQCGQQLTTVRDEPREHWLVVLAPGATEAVFVNCASAAGSDQCPRAIPTAVVATP